MIRSPTLVHSGLSSNLNKITDLDVVAHANLTAHDDVIARRRATGDPYLRTNQVVSSNRAVVCNHHQIGIYPFGNFFTQFNI